MSEDVNASLAARPVGGRSPVGGGATPPVARDYNIAAVDRALDLLEALSRIGPASLAELAHEAGCTRTAGFRLLRTLQARGFAIQDGARGAWRLGARWGMLGQAAASQGALAAAALPFMQSLSRAAGENVGLGVRDGLESETVALFHASEKHRRYTSLGQRRPLHAGPGRVLLAYAPDAVQAQVLAQRLPRFTPATPTDPKIIAGDLFRIRSRGYLITSEEVTPGAVTVAAPVRDAGGRVIAVMFVTAPSLRMRLATAPHLARDAAHERRSILPRARLRTAPGCAARASRRPRLASFQWKGTKARDDQT
jgi:IclR family transcriptional regulator, KDG regulon repressor